MTGDPRKLITIGLATAFASAVLVAGCGGDDSESPTPTQATIKSETPKKGPTGPASAGDERPTAPDDKISERPGGPKDKGKKSGY